MTQKPAALIVAHGQPSDPAPAAAEIAFLAAKVQSLMPDWHVRSATLAEPVAAKATAPAPYYLRMALTDKPGALAKVATVLGDEGISIDRMRQYGHQDTTAPVLIVTHKTTRSSLDEALSGMATTGVVEGAPVAIRIESV